MNDLIARLLSYRPLEPVHWLLLLAILAAVSLISRPFIPIDETRYVSVAWEMWQAGSFLVPLENGLPYSHKPPLLFWLIHGGWTVFGVNDWWPRLISPLAAFFSLLLFQGIMSRLWPGRAGLIQAAPMVLLATGIWLVFSQALMFDLLLGLWVLLGLWALVSLQQERNWWRWTLFGLAIGLGILTKGPAILLHLLPPALLAPWWKAERPPYRTWYLGLLAAVVGGAVIALAWAVPAGIAGGAEYRDAIFLGQTLDRVSGPAPHARPIWWYLLLLPVLLLPWSLWPAVYRGLAQLWRNPLEPGLRLALSWGLPTLIAFSLISGKQVHYLVPDLPAYAIVIARALQVPARPQRLWVPALVVLILGAGITLLGGERADVLHGLEPSIGLAIGFALVAIVWVLAGARQPRRHLPLVTVGVLVLIGVLLYWGVRPLRSAYDMEPMALAIQQHQESGGIVVHSVGYHDQYHFPGRLRRPLLEVPRWQLSEWLEQHPDALVVVYQEAEEGLYGTDPLLRQPFRSGVVMLLTAGDTLQWLQVRRESAGKHKQRASDSD